MAVDIQRRIGAQPVDGMGLVYGVQKVDISIPGKLAAQALPIGAPAPVPDKDKPVVRHLGEGVENMVYVVLRLNPAH